MQSSLVNVNDDHDYDDVVWYQESTAVLWTDQRHALSPLCPELIKWNAHPGKPSK